MRRSGVQIPSAPPSKLFAGNRFSSASLPRPDRNLSWPQLVHSERFPMATIRKRKHKWEVQIRRAGLRPISKSFHTSKDAQAWARYMEVQADRAGLPADPKALQRTCLSELVVRYRDSVSVA